MAQSYMACNSNSIAVLHLALVILFPLLLTQQYGRYFLDDIFKSVFLIEDIMDISIKGAIENRQHSLGVMYSHQKKDKTLPEPMVTPFVDTLMCHEASIG